MAGRIGSLTPALWLLLVGGLASCSHHDSPQAGIEVGNPNLSFSADFAIAAGDPTYLARTGMLAMAPEEMTWTQLSLPLEQVRYFGSYYYYMPTDPLAGQVLWPTSGADSLDTINILSGDSLQANFDDIDIPSRSYLKEIVLYFNLSGWKFKSNWCPSGGSCTPVEITMPDELQISVRYHHSQLERDSGSVRVRLPVRFHPKAWIAGLDLSTAIPGHDGIIHIKPSFNDVLLGNFARSFNGWGYGVTYQGVKRPDGVLPGALAAFDHDSSNRVANGTFTERGKDWIFLTQEYGLADTSYADSAVRVHVVEGGKRDYSVQLMQEDIELVQGRYYRLRFTAWTDSVPTFLVARIGRYHAPYDNLDVSKQDFLQELTKTPTVYEVEIQAKESTPFGRLEFNLGSWTRNVWIKDVSVVRVFD